MSILKFSAKFRKTITIKSYGAPTVNDYGVQTPGVETENIVDAIVIATSSEDMVNLPEGKRDRQTYTVFTDFPINSSGKSKNAIKSIINGELCEAIKVDSYEQSIIAHYKSLFQRVES